MHSPQGPDLLHAAFQLQVADILATPDEPIPRERLRLLKQLCLAAGQAIHLSYGLDLPSPEASGILLTAFASEVPAIGWLSTKIALSEVGCWELPLADEYDDKNRARYPQVSNAKVGARNELAHRFMMRVGLGATGLGRHDYIDHMCRVHACCNPTHLEFTTPSQNTVRGRIANKSVTGQTRLL